MILKTFIILIFLFSFSVFGQNGIKCIDGDCVNGTVTSGEQKKYTGYFKDGNYHGIGTLVYSNGDKYIGEFKKDKRSGSGTMVFKADKKIFIGKWKSDKQNGKGVYYSYSSSESVKFSKGSLVSR